MRPILVRSIGQKRETGRMPDFGPGRVEPEPPETPWSSHGRGWFRTSDLARVKSAQAAAVWHRLLPYARKPPDSRPSRLRSAASCCRPLFPARFQDFDDPLALVGSNSRRTISTFPPTSPAQYREISAWAGSADCYGRRLN